MAPPSPSLSGYAPSTPATSIRPSEWPCDAAAPKTGQPASAPALAPAAASASASASASAAPRPTATDRHEYAPRPATSEFAWRKTPDGSPDGKQHWYRRQDTFGEHCLLWQKRFPGHADMYSSMLLYEKSIPDGAAVASGPSTSTSTDRSAAVPADITVDHVRETMRRMRSLFPFVAMELVKRSDLFGVDPIPDIPRTISKHIDLQVALAYQIVHTDREVESWLDEIIVVHREPRTRDKVEGPEQQEDADFVAQMSRRDTDCNRLIVHFWPGSRADGIPPRLTLEQCHSNADGVGSALLIDDLVAVLADVMADPTPAPIQWGPEVCRLPDSFQDAVADQHDTWKVTKDEMREIQRGKSEQLNGKATAPNVVDRIGTKVVALTQRNSNSKNWLVRNVLNKPLLAICRSEAESGRMLPLGVLPHCKEAYKGPVGGTGTLTHVLAPHEAKAFIAAVKSNGLTPAPVLEAAMHMATNWVRRERGLNKHDGDKAENRVFGSMSNSISRRELLRPDQKRYHGLGITGIPSKIGADEVRWSDHARSHARPSRLDPRDQVPGQMHASDLEALNGAARNLSKQYAAGRDNPNWLRFYMVNARGLMEAELLFLTRRQCYPSMPWLSSMGRIEANLKPSRPIPGTSRTLEVYDLRIRGRMAIRQPALHVYSLRGEMICHFSYADWLYDLPGCDGRRKHRRGRRQSGDEWERDQSILQLCLDVFVQILRDYAAQSAGGQPAAAAIAA
ncbi:uncharacterized protein PSFLO_06831 [Pseudozyma flocculosa]|nr:uncharacterized protein PSFLO_06831 [Pseudozyma flocculosa]